MNHTIKIGEVAAKAAPEPDEYFKSISSKNAHTQAANLNLDIVVPDPNQLQIDIDSLAQEKEFDSLFETFFNNVEGSLQVISNKPSRSGKPGKRHITLTLNRKVTSVERILFQALLGSDRKRELLSYVRVLNGDPEPTLFFEKKVAP